MNFTDHFISPKQARQCSNLSCNLLTYNKYFSLENIHHNETIFETTYAVCEKKRRCKISCMPYMLGAAQILSLSWFLVSTLMIFLMWAGGGGRGISYQHNHEKREQQSNFSLLGRLGLYVLTKNKTSCEDFFKTKCLHFFKCFNIQLLKFRR